MEPWHFSHGEIAGANCLVDRWGKLQWSHGILAMESAMTGEYPTKPLPMLQWSHGILAMERRGSVGQLADYVAASMEPWHFSHGE